MPANAIACHSPSKVCCGRIALPLVPDGNASLVSSHLALTRRLQSRKPAWTRAIA